MIRTVLILTFALAVGVTADSVPGISPGIDSIYRLWDGPTEQINALWGENPKELQFGEGRTKVVIADLKGPGVITMIHFALPQAMKLNRDLVMRMFWDGETSPSVEAPLVDFFCDPNGALERFDSALVNKKRGWNCYFPMPFAKSARIELEVQNPRYPNGSWSCAPCYSYVMYRPVTSLPADAGYFHATWRQEKLLLGKGDYKVFEADGRGQFIGWNVTVRGVAAPGVGYPVDENVKFFVDGESEPSIEWQGLEDSFGFSWGFPPEANSFAYTGWQPYLTNGAAAYRFCLNDRVSFAKSMRMTVGPGKNEAWWFEYLSKPGNLLEFSSVAYWYQKEPHKPLPPIPDARVRVPSLMAKPAEKPHEPDETVVLYCGRSGGDIGYLKDGWDFTFLKGYSFTGWPTETPHCWADWDSLEFGITCPKGASGKLRMYILDGDNLAGGRKQSITVAGRHIGDYESFQQGQWVTVPISSADTAQGRISVVMKNLKPGGNAVVSIVRFAEGG